MIMSRVDHKYCNLYSYKFSFTCHANNLDWEKHVTSATFFCKVVFAQTLHTFDLDDTKTMRDVHVHSDTGELYLITRVHSDSTDEARRKRARLCVVNASYSCPKLLRDIFRTSI